MPNGHALLAGAKRKEKAGLLLEKNKSWDMRGFRFTARLHGVRASQSRIGGEHMGLQPETHMVVGLVRCCEHERMRGFLKDH